MKLVTLSEMLAIEKEADASGLTYDQMMQNAGTNLAKIIAQEFGYLAEEGALGLVGKGNNGGDTLVALTWLADQGWKASAYLLAERGKDPLVEAFQQAGGELLGGKRGGIPALLAQLDDHALLLDGVLGTGIKLPLRGNIAKTLQAVKEHLADMDAPPIVVAVDCPSGVNCDTGEAAAETLAADLTITMAAAKTGLYQFPAAQFVGELQLAGIGPLDDLQAWQRVKRFVVEENQVGETLPPRPLDAHKGTFGTVMVAAGSVNFTGAAMLAGKAAYRAGAGLVTLAVPGGVYRVLAGHFPEATWLLLPEELGVISEDAAQILAKNLKRSTALLLGPGFGLEETTRDFLARLLSPQPEKAHAPIGFVKDVQPPSAEDGRIDLPPLVVDADGLKLLAQIPDWASRLPENSILTPHPGEMAVLTGLEKDEIQAARVDVAERFAKKWGHVVVLKGAFTVVASPEGRTALVPVATPALARAGTGDVLAGVIAGLRAQGVAAFEAAFAGAWLHARAGLLAEDFVGSAAAVLAGDVLEALAEAMEEVE